MDHSSFGIRSIFLKIAKSQILPIRHQNIFVRTYKYLKKYPITLLARKRWNNLTDSTRKYFQTFGTKWQPLVWGWCHNKSPRETLLTIIFSLNVRCWPILSRYIHTYTYIMNGKRKIQNLVLWAAKKFRSDFWFDIIISEHRFLTSKGKLIFGKKNWQSFLD